MSNDSSSPSQFKHDHLLQSGRNPLFSRRTIPGLFVLATLAVHSPNLTADTIPPPAIEVTATGGISILTAGTVSGTGFIAATEGGSQSSTGTAAYSGGNASASANGNTSGGVSTPNSGASGEVTFYFEVDGSAPGVSTVPLIFNGGGTTSASGSDTAAYAYFETPGGGIYTCSASGLAVGTCGSYPSSNAGSITYAALPGGLYDLQVIASGESSLGSGSWSASVDPEVEIDPSFSYASDFSLDFSPGESTPPPLPAPTPEPSSILLLGTGILGVVNAVCRRLATRPPVGAL